MPPNLNLSTYNIQWQLLVLLILGLFHVKATNDPECPPSFFKCKNERCIADAFVCNNHNDCSDNSDELNCSTKLPIFNEVCKRNEYQCSDKFHCISLEEFCDNKMDCLDGSDEYTNCHLNKTCNQFQCQNGHCVNKNWICDGKDDCQDNSDETKCDKLPVPPEKCNNTINKYLCANKRCISLSLACNGENDCGDDSDENVLECNKAQAVCNTTHSCQHTCSATPGGYNCSCRVGYSLKPNGSCEDINECLVYGTCSQTCRNIVGSYQCQCEENYKLQEDGWGCKVENGEALMVFVSKTMIRGYYLESKLYFPIILNMQHLVGVSLDATHIYWTDIQFGDETIFRSLDNGEEKEVLVNIGLGSPEDIAVDWITGNIYFTDSTYKHVGVCNNNGTFCTVIIKENTEKPRGIALLPSEGNLFWSDWGERPHISRANMDGSKKILFIEDDIGWPNGLTIDYPSNRLYWVDAKLKVIDSILLNGQDRRIILHAIANHPYSIAIFEDRLYWSDWGTNDIHSCNKFNGKDYNTLFHSNETLYGLHIYHSSLKVKFKNPCITEPCSQLCLLTTNKTYTCACTLDNELSEDEHTCQAIKKKKHIAIVAQNIIIDYYQELLGKPKQSSKNILDHISALTYDSLTDSFIAADEINKSIFRFKLHSVYDTIDHIMQTEDIVINNMAFDYFGNNLYISNTLQKKIEVYSLSTGTKTEFIFTENPYDIILVPEEGIMFVVFGEFKNFHIDKGYMNGSNYRISLVNQGLFGMKISLAYDKETKRVYWADEGTARIESIDVAGKKRILFRTGLLPITNLVVLDNAIYWTTRKSFRLNWANKNQYTSENNGSNLQIANNASVLYLQIIDGIYTGEPHICRRNNGDCSHICLVTDKNSRACACSSKFVMSADKQSCKLKNFCSDDEIKCKINNDCIKLIQRCNGVYDCLDGEDETNCTTTASSCRKDEFMCQSGECINKNYRCDSYYHCNDNSDEKNCENHSCLIDEFRCHNGICIGKNLECNGIHDCEDFSDEKNCRDSICDINSFKCTNGKCIPKNWECDGQIDCPDNSDEHDSCKPSQCGQNMFSCKNGHCIDVLLKCNGFDDCFDNTDEISCSEDTQFEAFICTKDQYRCQNSTICINKNQRCNSHPDCPNQDDESGCSYCLKNKEFTCENGKCINLKWICDKVDDCGDNSDEQHCNSEQVVVNPSTGKNQSTNCSSDEFPCRMGLCLSLDKFCDGKRHCSDGSDEGGECESACETSVCENFCYKTPSGPVCGCRVGYKLGSDKISCNDINECERNVCPQLCTNLPGSFSCDCFDGYVLRLNRLSCKATGPAIKLIIATKDEIKIMSPFSRYLSLELMYRESGIEITGLDVNTNTNTVYWSNEILGMINKMNMETKKHTTAYIGVGKPNNLAIDWITDNVYFFDNDATPIIKICDIDANKCVPIVHIGQSHKKVTAIAINPLKEVLFWSEIIWKIFEKSTSSQIVRSDLIGDNQKIIIHENHSIINGLTVDIHRSKLYWTDNYKARIECVDFNGGNRKIILEQLLVKPISLYFYEDSLYWISENNNYLKNYQLYGDMAYSQILISRDKLNKLFVISQISRQPTGPNKCKNHSCDYMCVIRLGAAFCICDSGFPVTLHNFTSCAASSSGDELSLKNTRIGFQFNKTEVLTHTRNQSAKKSGGILTGLGITIAGFALIISLFLYLKKKRPGFFKRRDLSIHFQNPSFTRRNNNLSSANSILMPGEHEYCNPITEIVNSKVSKCENDSKKRLDTMMEVSDGEEDVNTTYRSRLIQ